MAMMMTMMIIVTIDRGPVERCGKCFGCVTSGSGSDFYAPSLYAMVPTVELNLVDNDNDNDDAVSETW